MTNTEQSLAVVESNDSEMRTFVLSAIAMSVATWDIAFFLGVFGTIFFEKVFAIWAAATAALLASFLLPGLKRKSGIGWKGRIVLAVPSMWLLVGLADNVGIQTVMHSQVLFALAIATGVIALPYMLYIAILMVTPDLLQVRSPRRVVGLVGIVFTVAALSFAAGRGNHLFLTCQDFEVSGNDLPAHCMSNGR